MALTLRHDADVEPRVEELARGELAKAVEGQVERCGLAHPSEAAIDLVGGHAASRDMSEDGGDPQLCRPGVTRPSAQLFPLVPEIGEVGREKIVEAPPTGVTVSRGRVAELRTQRCADGLDVASVAAHPPSAAPTGRLGAALPGRAAVRPRRPPAPVAAAEPEVVLASAIHVALEAGA